MNRSLISCCHYKAPLPLCILRTALLCKRSLTRVVSSSSGSTLSSGRIFHNVSTATLHTEMYIQCSINTTKAIYPHGHVEYDVQVHLVEHLPRMQCVMGSNPTQGSQFFSLKITGYISLSCLFFSCMPLGMEIGLISDLIYRMAQTSALVHAK